MTTDKLDRLFELYRKVPPEYHATSYWASYERRIRDEIASLNFADIRSGRYPILGTFGFGDVVYYYHPNVSWLRNLFYKILREHLIGGRQHLPYSLSLGKVRELAYRHCELAGREADAIPISEIQMDAFGNPADVFTIEGRRYSVRFLDYYSRYCYVHQFTKLTGNEIVVELGSGSGMQIEVLKKLYPRLTVLCFDMPAQLFLCESYLSEVLKDQVISHEETVRWTELDGIRPGKVHFFGNWQIPLVQALNYDIFWSAASFGEMEPECVKNYLTHAKAGARWLYLLQAKNGKEQTGSARVQEPMTFEAYERMVSEYTLVAKRDAWTSLGKMTESGGYFEGLWKKQ